MTELSKQMTNNNSSSLDENLYSNKINQRADIQRPKRIYELTLSEMYYEWAHATKDIFTEIIYLIQNGRLNIEKELQQRKDDKMSLKIYFESVLNPEHLELRKQDSTFEKVRKFILSLVYICTYEERYIWSGITIMMVGIICAFLFRL